jgi:NDP-sugar pyrophosphorylase family protein
MHITDIIFGDQDVNFTADKEGSLKDVPVVIMAGGKGTRLYPYTRILPKPLIPIGDVPIMERIIDGFTSYQVGEFFITVNYMKSMIKSYFEDISPEYHLHYVEEEKPLGTGGSLGLIKPGFDRPFFVTNCDILVQANLADIYKQHVEEKNAITIVTSLKKVVVPYGVLDVSSGGRVESIREKPSDSYFINTGMYVINPEMMNLIPDDTFYHMTQLIEDAISKEYKVGIYPITEDAFLDMGEIEELQKMEDRLGDKKIAEVIT